MRYSFFAFTLVFFAFNISARQRPEPAPPKSARSEATQPYFPAGVLDGNEQSNDFKERWYSSYLAAMDEPSLFGAARNGGVTMYRFLLVWNARALSVRVLVNPEGNGLLYGKLVIQHSDKPNVSFAKESVPVGKEQVQQFLALVKQADFWSMTTAETATKGSYHVDGAQWILEGVDDGTYHVVDRWSPQDTDYKRICSDPMELSPVKLNGASRKEGSR
jgi:hypothetical protein